MTKNKTVETDYSVLSFINSIPDKEKQKDCLFLIEMIKKQIKLEAKLWGPSIIGFGSYHYKYDSGREGDAPLISFSPRKNNFALYFGTYDKKDELLSKLGKYQAGKSCINIKNLKEIDNNILSEMIKCSIKRKIIY